MLYNIAGPFLTQGAACNRLKKFADITIVLVFSGQKVILAETAVTETYLDKNADTS